MEESVSSELLFQLRKVGRQRVELLLLAAVLALRLDLVVAPGEGPVVAGGGRRRRQASQYRSADFPGRLRDHVVQDSVQLPLRLLNYLVVRTL